MRAKSLRLGAAAVMGLLYACGGDGGAGPGSVPAIVVSPASATFQATANGANPATTAIAVTNGGDGTLGSLSTSTAYTGGQPTGWLTATLSGTAAPSTLTLAAATGALSPGTYNATVAIAAPTAGNTPQAVAVTFTVGQAPSIALSATSVDFQATGGGANPGGATVQITNSGGATLRDLSASIAYGGGEPMGWLSAALSGPTAPSTLTLTAATGTLAAGTYTATVAIASVGAANTPRSVTVTFTVDQAPRIYAQVYDSSFFFPFKGDPSSTFIVPITNSGGGTLDELSTDVTYNGGLGWLTATLGSAAAPTSLTVALATAPLSVGTYTATVTVSSPHAANTAHFTVTVRVLEAGIYVSESDPNAADDATCGLGPTWTGTAGRHPCRTINQGLARLNATGRPQVVVADGRYTEAVTLLNGRNLLGGYSPETWERHLSTTNTIIQGISSIGNHDRTVIAAGITLSTVFEGFVVRGSLNAKSSGNSYAIYVSNSNANLVIRNNVIEAGRGGSGALGSTGTNGTAGANGTGRSSNLAAYDAKIATWTGACNASNTRTFANGGVST